MSADTSTDAATDDTIVDDALRAWMREVTGAAELTIERRSGGASRAGYAVDALLPDGTRRELWLRIDTGFGPQSDTVYTVRREGAVYRALGATPVRVASLVAIHPTRDAFLAERLPGRNWFSQIRDPEEQERTARDFMQQLAALHAIEATSLDLPELGAPRSVREHVRDEIAIWRAQYMSSGEDEPVISLAFAWLDAHLPADGDWPVVLVQGDTGPGNFLYADGAVIAVMDWEMAHWGDLHDDLGWLCVRDTQERFTRLVDRFRDYEEFAGRTIDLERLRYFRVLAQMRCAVGTRRGLQAHDSRGEIANHIIFSTLHLRLLSDALIDAIGLPVAETAVVPLDDSGTVDGPLWLFDVALDDLREVVVPAIAPGFAQNRAKGLARLLKYLRAASRLGAALDAADRADLALLLGHPVDDRAAARAELCRAIAGGATELATVAAYCARATARDIEVARDAMGALADRRYAPIA